MDPARSSVKESELGGEDSKDDKEDIMEEEPPTETTRLLAGIVDGLSLFT